jgi:hypothetical protein
MERLQPPESPATAASLEALAPFEPTDLDALTHDARQATQTLDDGEGRALGRLHAALNTLLPSERAATALLSMLEQGAFDHLQTADGTQTRALAIAALLRQGYPWALQIHPDHLTWYRRAQRSAIRLKILNLLGSFSVGAALGFALARLF